MVLFPRWPFLPRQLELAKISIEKPGLNNNYFMDKWQEAKLCRENRRIGHFCPWFGAGIAPKGGLTTP
jgi:hypothetical protein